jgi:tripartite-type tricarboxylate transporter receptor subunit TctC
VLYCVRHPGAHEETRLKRFLHLALAAFALGTVGPLSAQNAYPSKPIRLMVGFPPGSVADIVARIVAPKLGDGLGQPVIVENRPGAGGSVASEQVARAAPDGYTLVLSGANDASNASLLRLGFDVVRDLAPIATIAEAPGLLVAHPSGPGSVSELVATAKAKPGQIPYASSSPGTIAHLWGELFDLETGVKLTHVAYKGAGVATVDVLAGRIPVQFAPASVVVPHIKAGRLKALATIGGKRLDALPDVPTIAELGIKGFDAALWIGLSAPAGTPPRIIERLNRETQRVIGLPEMKAQFAAQSLNALPGTSEHYDRLIRQDIEKWAKVVRSANIRID